MNAPDGAQRSTEPRRVEHAAAAADDSMQTHVERGIVARQFSGGASSRLRDHQARAAQNPVAMRAHDAGVDLGRQAEVVGVNDQALQTAPPRSAKEHRHDFDSIGAFTQAGFAANQNETQAIDSSLLCLRARNRAFQAPAAQSHSARARRLAWLPRGRSAAKSLRLSATESGIDARPKSRDTPSI